MPRVRSHRVLGRTAASIVLSRTSQQTAGILGFLLEPGVPAIQHSGPWSRYLVPSDRTGEPDVTTVNWERESGEKVQQFVAALIVLRFGYGNLITPSQGDRGIDVRVDQHDGAHIYQVKRYTRPLDSRQKRDVRESWQTFLDQTASVLPIGGWKLVMPLDPTNEALEWLEELVADSGIAHEWIGRTQLDAWAAENPRLVDYYFGDGAERLLVLMQQAITAGRQPPAGTAPEALLAAVQEQTVSLTAALDEIDPFYRYEVEVRAGTIPDADDALTDDAASALITYEQVARDYYTVTRLIPKSSAAAELRPITQRVVFDATPGTQDAEAIEQFRVFGRPFTSVEATVVAAEGPPGTPDPGRGLFTALTVASNAAGLPPLELRILNAAGTVLERLPARNVQRSSGIGTGGHWVSLTDACGIITFEFMFGAPDHDRVLVMRTSPPDQQPPADIARTLAFLAQFDDDRTLMVAVEDGPPFLGTWDLQGDEISKQAAELLPLVEDLLLIQQHTFHRVLLPPPDSWKTGEISQLRRAARLLRGEELQNGWTDISLTIEHPEVLPDLDAATVALRARRTLTVTIAGVKVATDRVEHLVFAPAHLEATAAKPQAGGKLRFLAEVDAAVHITVLPATIEDNISSTDTRIDIAILSSAKQLGSI